MDIDEILLTTEEDMEKAITYLTSELKGVRTGRASPALLEFVKVDYFGSTSDLRSLALISVPEATQLLVKPFDPSSMAMIVKAIQGAGLGLNPIAEGKQIRVNIPALSGERRQQLATSVKHMAEQAKVTLRNARRDGNKHIDAAEKDKSLHLSEDVIEGAKKDVQELLKKYEKTCDDMVAAKTKEIQQV